MATDDHAPHQPTPWWRDPPKFVPVLAGVLAIIGVPTIWKMLQPKPSKVSIEYVVDVSSAMRGKLGHKNKLRAITALIVRRAENRPDLPVAVRLAGHSCTNGYTRPLVGFKSNNGDGIAAELRSVRAGGDSDFANALAHATRDLQDTNAKRRTLYLFVGGRDTCMPAGLARETITEALKDLRNETSIEVEFRFVGIRAPRRVMRVLQAAKRTARRLHFEADVTRATKPSDLPDPLAPLAPGHDQYGGG